VRSGNTSRRASARLLLQNRPDRQGRCKNYRTCGAAIALPLRVELFQQMDFALMAGFIVEA